VSDQQISQSAGKRRRHPNSIVRLRGKRGWSIRQLAAASRLDEGTLRSLETGRTKLHSGHMQRLSTTFCVTVEELLTPCISRRNPQLSRGRTQANLKAGRGAARWAGRLPIPEHAHPLVKILFETMNKRQVMIEDLARQSGVGRRAISDWRYRRSPNLASFEAALGALGCELIIVDEGDE
jgi:transcriptional regulator with XRE-family HTH domain